MTAVPSYHPASSLTQCTAITSGANDGKFFMQNTNAVFYTVGNRDPDEAKHCFQGVTAGDYL